MTPAALSGVGAHMVRAVNTLLGVIGRSPDSLAGRVVSLLQDARVDLKPQLLAHYGARASSSTEIALIFVDPINGKA
jgi:hypothetical protein